MNIFEKYNEEIKQDLIVDQLNLLDKQMMLPAIKHKWVSRLMVNKKNKLNLEKRKKELSDEVLKTLQKEGIPTGVPKASLTSKIESSETIIKIKEEIQEICLIIEYLEKVEQIFKSMTYDLKNIVDIHKLETT